MLIFRRVEKTFALVEEIVMGRKFDCSGDSKVLIRGHGLIVLEEIKRFVKGYALLDIDLFTECIRIMGDEDAARWAKEALESAL